MRMLGAGIRGELREERLYRTDVAGQPQHSIARLWAYRPAGAAGGREGVVWGGQARVPAAGGGCGRPGAQRRGLRVLRLRAPDGAQQKTLCPEP